MSGSLLTCAGSAAAQAVLPPSSHAVPDAKVRNEQKIANLPQLPPQAKIAPAKAQGATVGVGAQVGVSTPQTKMISQSAGAIPQNFIPMPFTPDLTGEPVIYISSTSFTKFHSGGRNEKTE